MRLFLSLSPAGRAISETEPSSASTLGHSREGTPIDGVRLSQACISGLFQPTAHRRISPYAGRVQERLHRQRRIVAVLANSSTESPAPACWKGPPPQTAP